MSSHLGRPSERQEGTEAAELHGLNFGLREECEKKGGMPMLALMQHWNNGCAVSASTFERVETICAKGKN